MNSETRTKTRYDPPDIDGYVHVGNHGAGTQYDALMSYSKYHPLELLMAVPFEPQVPQEGDTPERVEVIQKYGVHWAVYKKVAR